MNSIQQAVIDSLPGKQKRTTNGWISFNAVCCHHNGESQDKRSRGGVITNGDAISYHCFNCNFKTGWQPGRHITFKMRKLLTGWALMRTQDRCLTLKHCVLKIQLLLKM